jgi:hypothetical protein
MIAAGLGCAFERDGGCSEGGLIAGGAIAVQPVVWTDDCFCAAVADHEGWPQPAQVFGQPWAR